MTNRTKSILIYVGGIITGIVLTFGTLYIIGNYRDKYTPVSMLDKPIPTIKSTRFSIIQVLSDGAALATAKDYGYGTIVLLLPKENMAYYDDQFIQVPKGQRTMQIGTFQYTTKGGIEKTVPIVDFFND